MKTASRILMTLAAIAAGTLVFPLVASAAKVKTPQIHADTKARFDTAAAQVRKEMVPGGRFQFVTKEEAAKVDTSLDAMGALFDKYGTLANMDQVVKVTLFNDQEVVNSILAQRDDLRLICKPEVKTGTRIPVTNCRTYGDIQRAQADTHNSLDKFFQIYQQRQPMVPGQQ
jgi:hypothetical protein